MDRRILFCEIDIFRCTSYVVSKTILRYQDHDDTLGYQGMLVL
jgi:hypothetical protein